MKPEQVKNIGGQIGGRGGDFTILSNRTKVIDMPPFTFGVVGAGINVAHRGTVDKAAQALVDGKEVVESYKKALKDVADHVDQAHKASKLEKEPPAGPEIKPPAGPGGIKPPGGPGFDPKGLDKMGGPGPNDIKVPGPDDIKGPGDLGKKPSDLDDLIPKDPKDPDKIDVPKQPGLDDLGNRPGTDTPNPNMPNPNLPTTNTPNLDTGDLDKKLQDAKTDLAGVDPKVPGLNDLANRNPTLPDGRLPGAPTSTGTGGFSGADNGLGRGSGGGSGGLGGAGGMGNIAKALNGGGMPMMPMAPMGGAGAGGDGNQDRERTTYLSEDEGVWGGDEDIAPPVLGKE
ncbi:hypothetical protein [Nonomuraea endophytica]|uniref:Uncharacterized protein n=1 Tax=Nonomuraea endophytica TaxID=714136 RepID=A0A7W7ZW22_9ACTN|nr:hypothetical protein [Nonomuraea endophytica]MBB5074864.1 hypothetical protein [Nonomuraea endophytica]